MTVVKRNLRVVVSSFFAMIFLMGCVEQQKRNSPETDASNKEVTAPRQIVSLEQAKELYDTYSERRVPLIQKYEDSLNMGKTKFDVARYTYYDYKTIKQYLSYIEQEADLAGVEISTLRFYFANYPDSPTFESGKKVVHPRQNSLFILPTIQQDGQDFGFYTTDGQEDGKRNAVLFSGQLQEYGPSNTQSKTNEANKSYASIISLSTGSTGLNIFQGKKSLILNEGSSAPPPHN